MQADQPRGPREVSTPAVADHGRWFQWAGRAPDDGRLPIKGLVVVGAIVAIAAAGLAGPLLTSAWVSCDLEAGGRFALSFEVASIVPAVWVVFVVTAIVTWPLSSGWRLLISLFLALVVAGVMTSGDMPKGGASAPNECALRVPAGLAQRRRLAPGPRVVTNLLAALNVVPTRVQGLGGLPREISDRRQTRTPHAHRDRAS
jgi:hypothetical protein